jgi:hypothetical protein
MVWVEELKKSLLRAGDHIAHDIPIGNYTSHDGEHFHFRLWHELPDGSKKSINAFIRLFAKEHKWEVTKVAHKKFSIEIIARPLP